MLWDDCPICHKGRIIKSSYDKGYYCTHGCWILKKPEDKQKRLE